MTFTGAPLSSTQYAAQIAEMAEVADNAPIRYAYGKWTCAEAGVGEVNMFKLPAGRIRFYPDLSWLIMGDTAQANCDLHVGHRAYVNEDGTAVTEDENEWLDEFDIGGGAHDADLDTIITSPTLMNSQDGIIVYVMFDTANVDLASVLELWFAYTHA